MEGMLDISYFRNNFDAVVSRLATRGNVPNLDSFRELDAKRRAAIAEAEQLKSRRNADSAEIAKLKREGADTSERQAAVREMGERIKVLDDQAKVFEDSFREILA